MEGKMFPYAMVESSVSPGVWVGPRLASRVVSLELFQFWGGSSSAEPPRPSHIYLVCAPPLPYPHDSSLCLNWNHFNLAVSSGNVRVYVQPCLPSWEESVGLEESVCVWLRWSIQTQFGISAASTHWQCCILIYQSTPCDLWWKLGCALASSSSCPTSFYFKNTVSVS